MIPGSIDIFTAIARGNVAHITRVIASDASVNEPNESGDTPLLYAVRKKRYRIIPLLLEAGANPNQGRPLSGVERRGVGKDVRFETPLSLATFMSDLKSIDLLLAAGAAIDRACEAAAGMNLMLGGASAKATVLKLLDAGLNPKASWKGVRFYRLAGNNEIRAKLESLGERLQPKRQSAPKTPDITRKADKFGVTSFVDFVDYWGHPTWAVLAVDAPIETVTAAYSKIAGGKGLWPNVPIRMNHSSDKEMAHLVALVQPKASKWVLIYRCMCLPFDGFDRVLADTKSISSKLKTRALAFLGHDTSGGMGSTLYRNGKKVEEHGWEYRTDPSNKHFAQLELFVPACYPRQKGTEICLVVMQSSQDRIERADLVDIGDF